MIRKKTSLIWTVSNDDFETFIKESMSKKEVLIKILGDDFSHSSYQTLNKRILEDEIDITHFERSYEKMNRRNKIPSELLFVNGIRRNNNVLKRRILEEKLMDYVCLECGTGDEWNGKVLVLQLDHINGNNSDNRLFNLRFLCPNCHTQTITFGMKNNFKKQCVGCSRTFKPKEKKQKYCSKICFIKSPSQSSEGFNRKGSVRLDLRKAERPNKEDLKHLLSNNSFVAIGKQFGVSDNAVRKWCKAYGIPLKSSRKSKKLLSESST